MISCRELKKRAKAKLKDAEVLHKNRRYDGCVYLCGYVIELALKARTCKTLKWTTFPETTAEFTNYRSFKTHNLDILLTLSGYEPKIKLYHFVDWNNVNQWNPEMRYGPVGTITVTEAKDMIVSTRKLLKML